MKKRRPTARIASIGKRTQTTISDTVKLANPEGSEADELSIFGTFRAKEMMPHNGVRSERTGDVSEYFNKVAEQNVIC